MLYNSHTGKTTFARAGQDITAAPEAITNDRNQRFDAKSFGARSYSKTVPSNPDAA
jgi:hypothetical protein